MTSVLVGSVKLMRLKEMSFEVLQFCCSIRRAGRDKSGIGDSRGGRAYDVEIEGR